MIASRRVGISAPQNPSRPCRAEERRNRFFKTGAMADVALPDYEDAKALCTQRSDLVDVARLIAGELLRPVAGVRFWRLLAERGILVSYESVRRWVNHFGPMIAADLRKRRPKPHTIWHLDEVYLKIDGRMVYLWRAIDAEGEVLDVLVQTKRNKRAALKLMRKLLKKYSGNSPHASRQRAPLYGGRRAAPRPAASLACARVSKV
jgi:hypothetical protein